MKMNNSQITVLAIDDEAGVLQQISGVLEGAGYRCHCAHDARSAGEAVHQNIPDLIIADLNLAGHSGLTLCEQLKQQANMAEVPVMYLSAAQVPDIIRRSHAAGGTYYVRKPFDAPVLLELVEKVMLVPHLTA